MLSVPHLVVIFVVALVVFGPEKIPELARNLGKIMAEFRRVTGDLRTTFEGHLRDLEREADQRRIAAPAASPVAAANTASAATPAPGTVPSEPPNAAAVAQRPEPAPAANEFLPGPGEPLHDPYLSHADFPTPGTNGEPEPSESAENSARVTDGDSRVS